MTTCPICCGSKTVRLPVRHPVSYTALTSSPMFDTDAYHTYDCPECVNTSDEKLHKVGAAQVIRSDDLKRHPEAREAVQKSAAHSLVGYLLRHDLVQFSEIKRGDLETEIVATIAVITPKRLTTLEQRIADAVAPAISKALEQAAYNVTIWNRDNDGQYIRRADAVRMIREAVRG